MFYWTFLKSLKFRCYKNLAQYYSYNSRPVQYTELKFCRITYTAKCSIWWKNHLDRLRPLFPVDIIRNQKNAHFSWLCDSISSDWCMINLWNYFDKNVLVVSHFYKNFSLLSQSVPFWESRQNPGFCKISDFGAWRAQKMLFCFGQKCLTLIVPPVVYNLR